LGNENWTTSNPSSREGELRIIVKKRTREKGLPRQPEASKHQRPKAGKKKEKGGGKKKEGKEWKSKRHALRYWRSSAKALERRRQEKKTKTNPHNPQKNWKGNIQREKKGGRGKIAGTNE